MLKILCCVKQVPDVDQMRMDPETGNLIRAGVPAILNPLDANALEAAGEGSAELSGVTADGANVDAKRGEADNAGTIDGEAIDPKVTSVGALGNKADGEQE